ncbi:MAG: UDP-N-acetylmuramoyl-L-alanyl-D-glutamate--2,6-diaminopimelate ligase, partial [Chitinispirillaceae bacterium]|nr:UDP-N-acetylmuramoyl-L-alanyl-D-glutamate--2,6-diaminopimelate ligase [Chitinispirillaceae bacterium]
VAGHAFVADALSRGAAAIVSERGRASPTAPWVRVENARFALGMLARALWNVNTDAILLAGVTGTNGKTTVAHLLERLFAERFGAEGVWMFGTIDYHLGRETLPATHTTPETLDIVRSVAHAARKPDAVAMEVSSHSLALDRVGGLHFDLAILTNVTQDHLDFHGDMEHYYLAKKRLFTEYLKKDGRCVINIDDPWGGRLARELPLSRVVTFGSSAGAAVRIADYESTWDGTALTLVAGGKTLRFSTALCGAFNAWNMAAAVAGGLELGFDGSQITAAFRAVTTVPGRMEPVRIDAPFTIVVDYAHTPDALVNVLQAARRLTKGHLVCVFGCGGDRDRTKRPLMGAAVAANGDEAIVTSDNPRSEDPEAIIAEIREGMPLDFPHQAISDRRAAIAAALRIARDGDCIVIAGKGHETYQEVAGIRHPFSDREVVREIAAGRTEVLHA